MTYTADDYRKAADVIESVYPNMAPTACLLRIRADRMVRTVDDEQAMELAQAMFEALHPTLKWDIVVDRRWWMAVAYTILTDGRWKRVEDA
ncbi:hypothetical protein SEA_DONKEYKONG_52 [Mycobacterium phage Donkeykong]|uniref:Uncharacterized protein n=2 Tax=Cheoctovirus TaxID=1623281 RepID=A0A6G9LDQ8_9CAUD|nr:hypothetical protein I5H28_gp052 [Mycobacterium phage Donkeykong]QGJ90839.1 hypothetical protein SEA_DONKEYKONG_52 [Mycobacterium phage Donkeykong]QIQ63735.1 hypothetical protein SEA_PHANPHAGIA_46 [Mycobacterium phage Phanphagia]